MFKSFNLLEEIFDILIMRDPWIPKDFDQKRRQKNP